MQQTADAMLDMKNTCIWKISGEHLTLRAQFQIVGMSFFIPLLEYGCKRNLICSEYRILEIKS